LPTLEGLSDLVEEARLAGADVVLERHAVSPLPAAIELCAVRVVQEGLTNAAKHALNPHVRVELGSSDGFLDIVVDDDGGAGPRAAMGTGHGLLGLRERVEVFHGTIDAAPRPGGGFRLHVGLPTGGRTS
jgi:signal transduction histidine kinase